MPLPRKGASAPTDADDRFDDLRHSRRTLASNGKQASVIWAGVGGGRRAWRTCAFCECARQHVGAGWTGAALASAQKEASGSRPATGLRWPRGARRRDKRRLPLSRRTRRVELRCAGDLTSASAWRTARAAAPRRDPCRRRSSHARWRARATRLRLNRQRRWGGEAALVLATREFVANGGGRPSCRRRRCCIAGTDGQPWPCRSAWLVAFQRRRDRRGARLCCIAWRFSSPAWDTGDCSDSSKAL